MIQVINLGRVPYAQALELQRALVERRKAGAIPDVLLLLEHPPVITLGRNAKTSNLIASRELLPARGIEIFECDRGGDVTYHGPGQLVGYPIFDLRDARDAAGRRLTLWPVQFVRNLEEILIAACGELGVPARRVAGLTGVWTDSQPPAKLAAIGVHVSRGVTSHGFALNVDPDLKAFDLIVPCGISDKKVTSLRQELKVPNSLDFESIAQISARQFGRVFNSDIREASIEEVLGPMPQDTPLAIPRELRSIHRQSQTFTA
jgi:lipoyl(octanoyl) transferase